VARQHPTLIRLERWTDVDFPLLVRLNSPEMTEHLGGPETDEQLRQRHEKYVRLADSTEAFIFKVVLESTGEVAGNVNFWEREWQGRPVYEMGWGVLPEFQGRGVASAAVANAIEVAQGAGRRDTIHAFPSIENGPSNAICRKAGFQLMGEVPFEYPKGHWMRCNDWRVTLR
jgi:RimJ/RimL family protein N-acetyltransferase